MLSNMITLTRILYCLLFGIIQDVLKVSVAYTFSNISETAALHIYVFYVHWRYDVCFSLLLYVSCLCLLEFVISL